MSKSSNEKIKLVCSDDSTRVNCKINKKIMFASNLVKVDKIDLLVSECLGSKLISMPKDSLKSNAF